MIVELEGLPPSPNRTRRTTHWSTRSALDKHWRSLAGYEATQQAAAQRVPLNAWQRVSLSITFYLPDRRRRDPGNLVGSEALKAVIDGLVDANVMADDSIDVIVQYGPFDFEYRKNRPGMRLIVEEQRA